MNNDDEPRTQEQWKTWKDQMHHESVHDETDTTKQNWVGTIVTNSGIAFNMENPTPNMVDIDDIAQALSLICRYNGQIPTFYSVAEHSVRVSDWLIDQGYSELALRGLLHDAAEAYVGDIVRPMKRMPKFAGVYNDIEQRVEVAIGEKFGVGLWPMHPKIKEADMAIYDWEVENIRSGKKEGWYWTVAKGEFMDRFNTLYNNHIITHYVYEDNGGIPMDKHASYMEAAKRIIDDSMKTLSPRRDMLNEAAELVDGDRNVQYGDPSADFLRTAKYWNAHIHAVLERKTQQLDGDGESECSDYDDLVESILGPEDVAIMMSLLKISRLGWSNEKRDTWVDLAGYAACGWNVVADRAQTDE